MAARIIDRVGTRIAGRTATTGPRRWIAEALIRSVGGVVLFDETGKRTSIPQAVIDGGIVPRGVSTIVVRHTCEGQTEFRFVSESLVGIDLRRALVTQDHITLLTN